MTFQSLLSDITAGLQALPAISTAVTAIKAAGASKESTLQKIEQITAISLATGATVGETIPNAQVQAVSTLVGQVVEEVFAPPASPTAA